MSGRTSFLNSVLATPSSGHGQVTAAIRSSMLSTLFENTRPLLLSGLASAFVALVALIRVHQRWAALWLIADLCLLAARLGIAHAYVVRSRTEAAHPAPWATRYAPVSLLACFLFGIGTMACVMSPDAELASLAVMVTAGILGGIASRNAALPYLAIAQICLGALPIGLGALLAPRGGSWILVPPLFMYIAAMASVVRRHYKVLVALMTAEQRHAELAARFDAALAHMPHGLCTIDSAGKVIIANRRTAELFGATVDMLKLNVPLPEFIGHVGLAKFGETLRRQLVEQCAVWLSKEESPFDMELNDGRQLAMTRNPVPDGSAVIIIEDVTERRESEAKILYLARHDPLTGLSNRRELRDEIERILRRSASNRASAVAVMYLDLDGFKQVNDRLGHHAGDEVLVTVADRLREMLQREELVARLGGDEFAIAFENATVSGAVALAQRIIRQIARPFWLTTGEAVSIGTSIGIAFAVSGESFERLMKRADAALYDAKEAGKGTYRLSTAEDIRCGTR
ncbi:sensor domain-containing diguanylate cyclase [Paraburkholderia lacunae]|uniref:GGDEF domain-containing protein n=1 Tax=Paraburkholderia lacunae TaxID=2211104 RepID=A0A370N7W2_9BURK|nr:sensor domain-containing diguanylate cyclase [Paraburkholderia lacunae]RDK01710.1 GGDEF domain-containing protein [Paraburkholderia lacunae]